jgi:hypothetical protein
VKLCECCCVPCLYKTGIGTLELKKNGGSLVQCTMCKENFSDDTIREIVEYSMNTVESLPRGDQTRIDREFLNVGTLMLMKDPQVGTLASAPSELLRSDAHVRLRGREAN